MEYLGFSAERLKDLGGIHTAREISQQPELWMKIFNQIATQKTELQRFMAKAKDVDKVILTGAGTSAYIGESLTGTFYRHTHKNVEAISTTNLVSHPYDYFSKEQSILLVSFARSGNSPESKAAVSLADNICKACHHLIITCNEEGDLANYTSKNGKLIISLPPESNDKSLAMTSSYTGMLLTALLISRIEELDTLAGKVQLICDYANKILTDYIPVIKEIADLPFKRAVFLGSGPLLGTATEAQLKLQELTDGNIICKHDSFLGFRHGPKAVVDNETLIVYFFSNAAYVSHYENDLVLAMKKGKKALAHVGISEHSNFGLPLNYNIVLSAKEGDIGEDFLTLSAIIPSQLLGFFKSLKEGLSPDKPSKSGAISRVVEGVKIYDL